MAARKLFGCFIQTQDGRKYIGNGSKHIIELKDNTQYAIGIDNKSNLRGSVQIEINEVMLAGNFHANPYECSTIHRGPKEDKSFVFISTSSDIAKHLGLTKAGRGQIHVSIRPEKPKPISPIFVAAGVAGGGDDDDDEYDCCYDEGEGVTVYGPPSGQKLINVPSFETQDCHNFYFMLKVGNPNRNTLYEGPTDPNGMPYPYSVIK